MLVQQGDAFGIMDLVPESKEATIEKEVIRHFTVMAMTHCEVFSLSLEQLEELIENYPSVIGELFEVAATRLERVLRIRKDAISFYKAQKRAESRGSIKEQRNTPPAVESSTPNPVEVATKSETSKHTGLRLNATDEE